MTFVDIWTTTYLPRLVNVVCEQPLEGILACLMFLNRIIFLEKAFTTLVKPDRLPNSIFLHFIYICVHNSKEATVGWRLPQET